MPSAGWDRNTGEFTAILEAERGILGKDKGQDKGVKFKVFPQENRMLEEESQAGQKAAQGRLFKNLKWRDALSWPREV